MAFFPAYSLSVSNELVFLSCFGSIPEGAMEIVIMVKVIYLICGSVWSWMRKVNSHY